jgi:hypothetical protein
MTDILIEKGVDIPPRNDWKGPLDKLEIGDSFTVAKALRGHVSRCVSSSFHALTKKVFEVRKDPLDPQNKVRVKRLKDKEE